MRASDNILCKCYLSIRVALGRGTLNYHLADLAFFRKIRKAKANGEGINKISDIKNSNMQDKKKYNAMT